MDQKQYEEKERTQCTRGLNRLALLIVAATIAVTALGPQSALGQTAGRSMDGGKGAHAAGDYDVIRIALATSARHVVLGVNGDFRIRDSLGKKAGTLHNRKLYFVDVMGDGNLAIRDSRGKTIIEGKADVRLIPDGDSDTSINFQVIDNLNAWESSQLEKAASYRGAIRLMRNPEGLITVVNHVKLEDYVAGIVGTEIGNFAPPEALRAQAVAARSEALFKIIRAKGNIDRPYDFGATSADQAYTGNKEINGAVREAVAATAGVVMTWEGRPIDAVYGHSCGGITVDKTELWGGKAVPYLRRQRDYPDGPAAPNLSKRGNAHDVITREIQSLCNPRQEGFPEYAKDNFRWQATLTSEELTAILDPAFGTGQIQDVDVVGRSASGRVTKLRVKGRDRTVDIRKELKIRWALGNLKSTFFTYQIERSQTGLLEEIHIFGAGYGHGVGMCQMGAFMLGKRGSKARDILLHYYPGVEFKQLKKPVRTAM